MIEVLIALELAFLTYKFLQEKHRLSPEKIVDDILNEYKKN